MERMIDDDHAIRLDYAKESDQRLQVMVVERETKLAIWIKRTDDGKQAIEIFHHPFFYGFGLDR